MTRSSMTRTTLSGSDPHFDRGDSTCGHCFEEWPCRGVTDGLVWSGVQEWEMEDWRAGWEREKEEKRVAAALVNETFARLGVDIELRDDCSGQMLHFEQFVALADKIRETLDSRTSGTVD